MAAAVSLEFCGVESLSGRDKKHYLSQLGQPESRRLWGVILKIANSLESQGITKSDALLDRIFVPLEAHLESRPGQIDVHLWHKQFDIGNSGLYRILSSITRTDAHHFLYR